MKSLIDGNGEIKLLNEDGRFIGLEGLEQWQIDQLLNSSREDTIGQATSCLQAVDTIVSKWLTQLTKEDWQKIQTHGTLRGIEIPKDWIKVWRFILKEPDLRDSEKATKSGRFVGNYIHLWNLWSEDCIKKYLTPMEQELIYLNDLGMLHSEIADFMIKKYGNDFWNKRKEDSKTTGEQVVNYYFYLKMPTTIARSELTDMVNVIVKKIKPLD